MLQLSSRLAQPILGEFPNAPEELRASIAVDAQPKNRPDKVDAIDGTLKGRNIRGYVAK